MGGREGRKERPAHGHELPGPPLVYWVVLVWFGFQLNWSPAFTKLGFLQKNIWTSLRETGKQVMNPAWTAVLPGAVCPPSQSQVLGPSAGALPSPALHDPLWPCFSPHQGPAASQSLPVQTISHHSVPAARVSGALPERGTHQGDGRLRTC